VIDYTEEDFTTNGQQYDLILDLTASHSILDYKRSLSQKGKYIMVGGSIPSLFQTLILGSLISIAGSKKMGVLGHRQKKKDMEFMTSLLESGILKPVIDKQYPLIDAAEAFRHLGNGKALGKVVITM